MILALIRTTTTLGRPVSYHSSPQEGSSLIDYHQVYLVSFLAAELPGGLISKKVGPYRYTPAMIILWGGLCMAQAGISNRASFWALRALLGIIQGGFIPEMVLYLSYFYKGNELPIRLSIFYTVIPLTQAYGAVLAAGLLAMRGIRGWGGWQWL